MNQVESFRGKTVITDYRYKFGMYAGVCWTVVIVGIFAYRNPARNWQFWTVEVLMIGMAVYLSFMLLNRRYLFVGKKGPLLFEYLRFRHSQLLEEYGQIAYSKKGFSFVQDGTEIKINWDDIRGINASLIDGLAHDDNVTLEFNIKGGGIFQIDEEISGWMMFETKLREAFPQIPEDWEEKLIKGNETVMKLL